MEQQPQSRREHELRPSGETSVEQLIAHGIEHALREQRVIDELTARLIAHYLAPNEDSALASFAYTGRGSNLLLRAEYLPIYHHDDTAPEVRELIDWFGSRAMLSEDGFAPAHSTPGGPRLRNFLWRTEIDVAGSLQPVSIRADKPNETLDELPDRLAPLIGAKGTPFRSFLTLKDVDATADNLLEAFANTFLGTFTSMRQILDACTDAPQIREAIDNIRENYVGGHYVDFAEDGLLEELREHWDFVRSGGAFHVFAQ